MTREEREDAIVFFEEVAKFGDSIRVYYSKLAIEALEQESCDDEYIKVPKKALKYRTKGMVAYNAEWLKNHFDIERAVICGAQEPVLSKLRYEVLEYIDDLDIANAICDIFDKYEGRK